MIEIYKKNVTAEVNSGKYGKRAKLQKTVNLLSRYLYFPPLLVHSECSQALKLKHLNISAFSSDTVPQSNNREG